jgi:hypothetical protein
VIKRFESFNELDPYGEEIDEDDIVIKRYSENYTRREVIDNIYNCSNISRRVLNNMTNDELEQLWQDMEMDDILSDD